MRRNVAIALVALITCAGLAAFALMRPQTEQLKPEADPFWRSLEPLTYGMAVGHVRDAERGTGLNGASLAVEAIAGQGDVWPMGIRSGDRGRFVLHSIASPGSYRVRASAPGFESHSKSFDVKARRITILELRLERQ